MNATSKDSDKQNAAPADGFSAEERAAIKQRAAELRAEARAGRGAKKAAAEEEAVLAKITGMEEPDRTIAERVHAVVTTVAPELAPKLWYGQPAYAKDGKVICFFRSGHDDKERYSTFGFSTAANLDAASGLWPTSYALTELNAEGEAALAALVARAVA